MPQSHSLQALQTFIDGLDPKTRQRGKIYALQGRVRRLARSADGTTLSAVVHGTHVYNTSLAFQGDHWWSQCDCPVGDNCKHAAALAHLALTKREHFPTLQTPAPSKPAAKIPKVFPDGLPAHLMPWEKRRALALEEAYQDYFEGAHTMDIPSLETLFGQWPEDDNEVLYEIFPEERLTPEQFWHFLLVFARDAGVERIPDFGPLNDTTPTLALIEKQKAKNRVTTWRNIFQNMTAEPFEPVTEKLRLRLRILSEDGRILPEIFHAKKGEFTAMTATRQNQILTGRKVNIPARPVDALILRYLEMKAQLHFFPDVRGEMNPDIAAVLGHILESSPADHPAAVGPDGLPLRFSQGPATWQWVAANPETVSPLHALTLAQPDGTPITGMVTFLRSHPPLCISGNQIHRCPDFFAFSNPVRLPLNIPEEAMLTDEGIETLLEKGCGLPPALGDQVQTQQPHLAVRLQLVERHGLEYLHLAFEARMEGKSKPPALWSGQQGWRKAGALKRGKGPRVIADLRRLHEGMAWMESWEDWSGTATQEWHRPLGKNFAEQFIQWTESRPPHVLIDADAELASLLEPGSAGTWTATLEPKGVDWFDLSIQLSLDDTTLTAEETRALIDAQGALVRLPGKGWRRLSMDANEDVLAHVRESGIDPTLAAGTRHRLHALQVASSSLVHSAPPDLARQILARALELENAPPPPVPSTIKASLRPYQVEGFHFLCRMARAHLGGVLADDMGLGKTVQALAWLAWLRETEGSRNPSLVVCPKSVMDVWIAEAERFFPTLPLVRGALPQKSSGPAPLVVLNYAQLRNLEKDIDAIPWQAALLDEGQFIKNPDSQSAKAACGLNAAHRIVLSGTPIENRLLDLWSLMQFAMPGILGSRAAFGRHYHEKRNPQARSLLARRVRPFLLRRTKNQVARDLPERIEEDIPCELEGAQLDLYNAHLKEARRILLDLKTTRDLDKARFNILTSLLRLRQACCHPSLLIKGKKQTAPSAKMDALVDLLDPLLQEGHKVLIFSQFVEMLGLLRAPLQESGWPIHYLDGSTENRQDVVRAFQSHEGSAAFLISLKAGGAGLNLTAASYVVLFDPWWNPAVEAQAIDRTHRIGQDKTVIAYRLIAKNTIEEKIRQLQKAKSQLFQDVLGEENFAKALSLDDFRFLLQEDAT
jgi:hypothetical protein